jgi:hypothetical protein
MASKIKGIGWNDQCAMPREKPVKSQKKPGKPADMKLSALVDASYTPA